MAFYQLHQNKIIISPVVEYNSHIHWFQVKVILELFLELKIQKF